MQSNRRFWLQNVVLAVGLANALPLTAMPEDLARVRQQRLREHEKGNASEFVGKWQMRLPAGFEYAVELKANEAGLLELTGTNGGLLLLGEFACKGTELYLVKSNHKRVDDYIWQYRDGKFVLIKDEQGHGGNYLRATLTRLK